MDRCDVLPQDVLEVQICFEYVMSRVYKTVNVDFLFDRNTNSSRASSMTGWKSTHSPNPWWLTTPRRNAGELLWKTQLACHGSRSGPTTTWLSLQSSHPPGSALFYRHQTADVRMLPPATATYTHSLQAFKAAPIAAIACRLNAVFESLS